MANSGWFERKKGVVQVPIRQRIQKFSRVVLMDSLRAAGLENMWGFSWWGRKRVMLMLAIDDGYE